MKMFLNECLHQVLAAEDNAVKKNKLQARFLILLLKIRHISSRRKVNIKILIKIKSGAKCF